MAPRGTKAKLCDGDSSTAAIDLRPATHEGVVLQPPWQPGGQWKLFHSLTMEGRALPEPRGAWQIVRDDKGFAAIVDTDPDGACFCCDDLLRRAIFVDQFGERYMVENKTVGEGEVVIRLKDKQSLFRSCTAVVCVGPTSAKHSFQFFFLSWPRPGGYRMFWKMSTFYTVFGLVSYRGVASKWIWAQMKQWDRQCRALHQPDQLIHSVQHDGAAQTSDIADGFLPSAAASTFCLVQLLIRWHACTPNDGGLREPRSRRAAQCLLEGFLRAVFAGAARVLQLNFSQQFVQWPMQARPHVVLPIDDGTVSLGAWHALVERPVAAQPRALEWWRKLDLDKAPSEMPLDQFLRLLLLRKVADLAAQVIS